MLRPSRQDLRYYVEGIEEGRASRGDVVGDGDEKLLPLPVLASSERPGTRTPVPAALRGETREPPARPIAPRLCVT